VNAPLLVAGPTETWGAIRRVVRSHRRRLALMLGWHALAVGSAVSAPVLFGMLIDSVTAGGPWDRISALFLVLCGVLVVRTVLGVASQDASWRFGEDVFAQLRDEVVEGVVRLPLRVTERAERGEVLARTSNDVDAVSEGVRVGVPEVLVGVFTVLFTTAASFVLDWRVAIASVVGLPILVLSTRWYVRRSQSAYEAELRSHARFNGSVLETVTASRTLGLLGTGDRLLRRIDSRAREVKAAERVTLGLQSRWFPVVQLGYYLPFAVVATWGGWLAVQGEVSVGTVVAIALNVQLVVDPLDDLLYWSDQLQLAWAAFRRMSGVSRPVATSHDDDEMVTAPVETPGRAVHCADVSFSYDDGPPAVSGIDLDIAHGEHLAVLGPSGAGKTTLGLLIAGALDPDTGRIAVGRESRAPAKRMMVSQDPHAFSGTLRDNLALAARSASDGELLAALALAGAPTDVDGLDVELEATSIDPVHLQRIALARVVLRDPDVVVLDESTSHLSVDDSRVLDRDMAAVFRGRTVVTIAHRMSAALDADRVLTMEHGRVSEIGTPRELLDSGGLFAELHRQWTSRTEEGNHER
jgi:ABC-type multidrug transport system fused ATPase/permease subunit